MKHILHKHTYVYTNIDFYSLQIIYIILKSDFMFREREREGEEKERKIYVKEKHWSVASHMRPYWGPKYNPGMCPDQGSKWWPFTLWDDAQPTESHLSGLYNFYYAFELMCDNLENWCLMFAGNWGIYFNNLSLLTQDALSKYFNFHAFFVFFGIILMTLHDGLWYHCHISLNLF